MEELQALQKANRRCKVNSGLVPGINDESRSEVNAAI